MKKVILILSIFSVLYMSAQEKDFYDLKRIKEVLSDSTEVIDLSYKINIIIVKNLTEANQLIKSNKNSFLIIYFNQDKLIAEKNITKFINESYPNNDALLISNNFLQKIDNLFIYITDKKEELINVDITSQNQSLIAVIDNNLNLLYKVQFKKFHVDFLNIFNEVFINLYKYSTFDRILSENPISFNEFKDKLLLISKNIYDTFNMHYVLRDKSDQFYPAVVDEYWSVNDKYELKTYNFKTSKNKFNEKFNELFLFYSNLKTDYSIVEILISEILNDGYTGDLFLSTSKERVNDFKLYIEYILKYNSSKYDKNIIGSRLSNFLNVTSSEFTKQEKIDFLRKITIFSNFNTNCLGDYLNEISFNINNDLEFEKVIDNYIVYYGDSNQSIDNSFFEVYKKFKIVYSEIELNDFKLGFSNNLIRASNIVLRFKKDELYVKASKWSDIANNLYPNNSIFLATNAILKYRTGNTEKSLELKEKAIKIAKENKENINEIENFLNEVK